MFGYLVADTGALTEEQFARYRACYCGLCRSIRERHGQQAGLSLTYDMAFLVLLLSSLYEPEERAGEGTCMPHPVRAREYWQNEITAYAADLNTALAYLKCLDDWEDDGNLGALAEAKLLEKSFHETEKSWPRQCEAIRRSLDALHALEKNRIEDADAAAASFGELMAELMQGTGMVEARDLTEYKVGLMEENRIRHGLSNMMAVQQDALVYDEASHEKADVLVCDLPCSGLGVMAKKTDIRYKMTKEKAEKLALLQRQILNVVHDYVKPGGILLYSTCTIRKSENEENVDWFLSKHSEFSLEMMRQMYPGEVGNDGFFLAKLVKKDE